MAIEPLNIITLVPQVFREDWLEQCVNSVKNQPVPFTHRIIPCKDFYLGRKESYKLPGRIAAVDYDDWLEPGILEDFAKTEGDLVFTGPQPVKVTQVKRTSMAIHHLVALNSSLVPESFYQEIEFRRLTLHVDWLIKAYVFLTQGGVRIAKHGYNWRRHEGQMSFVNRGHHGRITRGCIELLNEIPVKPGFFVSN